MLTHGHAVPCRRMSAMEVLDHPWVRADGVATNNRLQHEVVTRLQGFAAMNKLKKEALKIIAGFLPENEIKVRPPPLRS